jgi:hypothetical protein
MKYIELTQGQVARVSDEDYEWLAKYKWHARWDSHAYTFYAGKHLGKGASSPRNIVTMHSFIMGARTGERIDHIDHNGLHNERENLRRCTCAQNAQNHMKHRVGVGSKYKGVSRCMETSVNPWRAQIYLGGKNRHLGVFADEESAARAYDTAARLHFGEFALLNFPQETLPKENEMSDLAWGGG